jgi:hypothetical protein
MNAQLSDQHQGPRWTRRVTKDTKGDLVTTLISRTIVSIVCLVAFVVFVFRPAFRLALYNDGYRT